MDIAKYYHLSGKFNVASRSTSYIVNRKVILYHLSISCHLIEYTALLVKLNLRDVVIFL